jgi:hypothetical protein
MRIVSLPEIEKHRESRGIGEAVGDGVGVGDPVIVGDALGVGVGVGVEHSTLGLMTMASQCANHGMSALMLLGCVP